MANDQTLLFRFIFGANFCRNSPLVPIFTDKKMYDLDNEINDLKNTYFWRNVVRCLIAAIIAVYLYKYLPLLSSIICLILLGILLFISFQG